MFECGIGEQYASDDHSGFADDSGESDAFIACQFISSHRYHRLSPRAIAGVDKWVMLGIGIVIWVIGAIMSTAAFFSLERGMCDDASGVDHIAEHERLRIASDDFVEGRGTPSFFLGECSFIRYSFIFGILMSASCGMPQNGMPFFGIRFFGIRASVTRRR